MKRTVFQVCAGSSLALSPDLNPREVSLGHSVHIYQRVFFLNLAQTMEGRTGMGQVGVRAWEQKILHTPLLRLRAFLKNCMFPNLFK